MNPFKFLKDYFSFTKGEKNGILCLMVIIVILLTIPGTYRIFRNEEKTDFSTFKKAYEDFENSRELPENSSSISDNDQIKGSLFSFDPNKAGNEDWQRFGANPGLISVIKNYLKKGGRFYTKQDLKKIYGFPDSLYRKLEPFINILQEEQTDYDKTLDYGSGHSSLFNFDPNTASDEDFTLLSLNKEQIKVIRKYLNKGGKFSKKEDLSKIFVISHDKYIKLEPYIEIMKTDSNIYTADIMPTSPVEINSADTSELNILKGIGNTMAARIINYRNKLGGFIRTEQLLEVYGISNEAYERIAGQIILNIKTVKKININFATAFEMDNHPYLNYREAKAIEKYRTENGSFTATSQLLEKHVLSFETYNKIKDYLVVE